MKIGIDARMMSPAFGIGRYVEQLIRHLEIIDHENEYIVFLKKDNWDRFTPHQQNIKKVLADISWYSFQEQWKFSHIVKREHVDIMHFTHFNVPLLYNDPYIVTIHDLTMYHFPRPEATTHGRVIFWLKDKAHRLVVSHAVRRARHIIATSQYTKQDIVDTLGVKKNKISVIYQAPFESVVPFNSIPDVNPEDYGIVKPYVLYVGAAYPHKNLDTLLNAWSIFQEQYSGEYQLVLVGSHDYFYTKIIEKSRDHEINNIIFTGFIEDKKLIELYENAQAYVFPSLYEGFGLPPLEAMSHGTPVVSSNASCMPEILGEAAIYFDPQNAYFIAGVIHQVLIDKDLQMMLQQNARELLKHYSWKKLANETLKLYLK